MLQKIKDWFVKEKSYIDHWFDIDERWRYLMLLSPMWCLNIWSFLF